MVERTDYDTRFLYAADRVDLRRPFDNLKDELILKALLDTWGPSGTGEILDYVYFRTEPMEQGIRNEPLDFSRIQLEVPATYRRVASDTDPAALKKQRKEFSKKMTARPGSPAFHFTEPRYDEEFRAAMEKLDSGNV